MSAVRVNLDLCNLSLVAKGFPGAGGLMINLLDYLPRKRSGSAFSLSSGHRLTAQVFGTLCGHEGVSSGDQGAMKLSSGCTPPTEQFLLSPFPEPSSVLVNIPSGVT